MKRNFPIFDKADAAPPPKKANEAGEQFTGPIKIWSWNVAGLRACVKVIF